MGKVVFISGASSGFGAMSARHLAAAGHTVYAGMRDIAGRNQKAAAEAIEFGNEHGVELRPIELDVTSQASVDACIAKIIADRGRLDVVIQNAGHMVLGPSEAGSFTTGTNHFANAGHPADAARASEYEQRYAGLSRQVADRLAALAPPDADPADVARAVVAAVDAPEGKRPFRVHVDPADDGSGVVSAVADHIRAEFLKRVGLGDLLRA